MQPRFARATAHHAPPVRRAPARHSFRPNASALVACAGCGAEKRKPLEARAAGQVHPPFRAPRRVERGAPVCVYCYVQLETFGRTRLDDEAGA